MLSSRQQHSGQSPLPGDATNANALWTFNISSTIITQPVIDRFGVAYVISQKGCVHAVSPPVRTASTATQRWKYCNSFSAYDTPRVLSDDSLLLFKPDGTMYRIATADGKLLASANILQVTGLAGSLSTVTPLVLDDGSTLFFTSGGTACFLGPSTSAPTKCSHSLNLNDTVIAAVYDKYKGYKFEKYAIATKSGLYMFSPYPWNYEFTKNFIKNSSKIVDISVSEGGIGIWDKTGSQYSLYQFGRQSKVLHMI